ncbi:MAG: 2-C-methyl-D-erythritol 4-phosphate cytidylyltransferase [Mycobacteriales bacterium]
MLSMPLRRLAGVPLVVHAARALRASGILDSLVVVAPPDAVADVREWLAELAPATALAGPPSRHGSLHCGLSALGAAVDTVVVHDACRPLAPAELAVRTVAAVRAGADLAVPVLEMTETVKELDADGWITRTVPRESMVRVQAPCAVRRDVLDAAHRGCAPADEGAWLTGTGIRAVAVDGHDDAFAVLQEADLDVAAALLASRRH